MSRSPLNKILILLSLNVFCAGGSPVARAAESVVGLDGESARDTSIYADQPDRSNGGHPFLYAGATGSSIRRCLIQFDLQSIPRQASVTGATVRLTINQSGAFASDDDAYRLHRLLADWGEGAANSPIPGGNGASSEEGDATWLANRHLQSQWADPGGDFAPEPSAEAAAPEEAGGDLVFSSDALAEDIRNWIANPDLNHGWILIGEESTGRTSRRFVSSEGSPREHRPRLIVTWTGTSFLETWELYP